MEGLQVKDGETTADKLEFLLNKDPDFQKTEVLNFAGFWQSPRN